MAVLAFNTKQFDITNSVVGEVIRMSTPEDEQSEARFEAWLQEEREMELLKWIELWLPELNPIQINILMAKIEKYSEH